MRRSYGGNSDGAAFDRSKAWRRASRWFKVHPALLRSAVAVGVAAVAIVLVTSEALVRSDDGTAPAAEGQVLLPKAVAAAPALAPQPFGGGNAPLATGTFAPTPTMTASLAAPGDAAASEDAAETQAPGAETEEPLPAAPEIPASAPAQEEAAVASPPVADLPAVADPTAAIDETSPAAPARAAETAPAPSRDLEEALALAAAEATALLEADAAAPADAPEGTHAVSTALPEPPPTEPTATAETEVCPRDWVSGKTGDGASVPAGCEPIVALLDPVEEDEQAAIEEAAVEQAMQLGVVFARIPLPRPDPPARPRRTSRANLDWPPEPPPNCGTKHAYWRFVDREAGTKEWYCK